MLIEYDDPAERAQQLRELRGLERHCWMQVAGCPRVTAIADEDLPRENEQKTSAVHFLRFEFTSPMVAAWRAGAALSAGIDHAHYADTVEPLGIELSAALLADLA
jgi:hypothetical protein